MNNIGDIPVCPKCGSVKTSCIGYSCPAIAICDDCGHSYEFGEGIRVLGVKESIERRPSMYKEYLCEKCNKYRILIDTKNLSEEDKEMLCTCHQNNIKENE